MQALNERSNFFKSFSFESQMLKTNPFALRRKYASFFEVPNGCDRRLKEKSVAEEFCTALRIRDDSRFGAPRLSRVDPPDCIASFTDNGLAAIEVTELVCESAIRANEFGQEVYRVWSKADLTREIGARLRAKDKKNFHGGPYDRTVVVLHTDEMDLRPDSVMDWLRTHEFGPYAQIDEAYLLFSYHPAFGGYALLSLRLAARHQ